MEKLVDWPITWTSKAPITWTTNTLITWTTRAPIALTNNTPITSTESASITLADDAPMAMVRKEEKLNEIKQRKGRNEKGMIEIMEPIRRKRSPINGQ